ncbi:PP2C family protein-serine/threonine phosphatase [Flindersiella endophytica]
MAVKEAERLEALDALHVLDTPPEPRFDRVVRLAQRLFGVPLAAVTLLDDTRQWYKAKVGFSRTEVPRQSTFCDLTIQQPGPLIIPDTFADDRFREHPAAVLAGLRFYAGHPLTVRGEFRVGTLCLADLHPRQFSTADAALLTDLAAWVEKELTIEDELRRASALQQSLYPRQTPRLRGYDLAGVCLSAGEVGGDFFDWQLTGNRLQFVIGDAMGKGLPAAITAAGVRAMLKGLWHVGDLGSAMEIAARGLESDFSEASSFVTLFYARLDIVRHRLFYVDAGHGLTQIVGRDGGQRRLSAGGLPLGVTDDAFVTQEEHLDPGDTLICVSDGYLELFPKSEDALGAAAAACGDTTSAQELVDLIAWHATRRPATDDVTVLVLRRAG